MASTLVALLQQWLLEVEENEIQVTVGDAHLVIYKPCGLDNSNPTSKLLCLTSLSTTLQGAVSLFYSINANNTLIPIAS